MTDQQVIDQLDALRQTMPPCNSWRTPTYAITKQYNSRDKRDSWDITFYRGNGTMIEGRGATLEAAWSDFLGQLSRSSVSGEVAAMRCVPEREEQDAYDYDYFGATRQ